MIFCVLTIALTFAVTLLPLPGELAPVVMVFIPAVTAILITALSQGGLGVRSLLGKLTQWRISLKWVVIAAGPTLGMKPALQTEYQACRQAAPPAAPALDLLRRVDWGVAAICQQQH
jgi:hypothetical protein